LTVKVLPAIVTVPLRVDVAPLAAMLNPTVPLPVPVAPLVTVSHEALLTAAHPHADVTPTEPIAAPDPTFCEPPDTVAVQAVVNSNVFDRALLPVPLGPTAATTASYDTPSWSGVERSVEKSTRIIPSLSGVGLPRFAVVKGVDPPAT
jgi:hypothetical protein